MANILEKAYNCYIRYLSNLAYGKTDQDYKLLYGATLLLKNKITDEKFIQCFDNRLICPGVSLNVPVPAVKLLTWIVDSSTTIPTNNWNEIVVSEEGVYTFLTNEVAGMGFIYISVPRNFNFEITDGLNQFLYDSQTATSSEGQSFMLVGSYLTSEGVYNNVYRKKDMYSSENSIFIKVNLYQ